MTHSRILSALAALNGLLAVAIGAFGAHAIQDPQAQDWIRTATQFQLPHAAAVIALLAWRPEARLGRRAASGSSAAMALNSVRWNGKERRAKSGAVHTW